MAVSSVSHHDVCVVIPMYKAELSHLEQISLNRCVQILGNYNIAIVKPRSLDVQRFSTLVGDIIDFDDHFFDGVSGYNALMLSPHFYAAFSAKFQWILIHQLDAFVFSDRLLYWCQRGYDYIGAPWPHDRIPKNKFKALKVALRNYLAVKTNKMDKETGMLHRSQLLGRVGNGGFSLRNASKFQQITLDDRGNIARYLSLDHHHYNEDVFWSIEVNRKKERLRIPKAGVARDFAFENYPERLLLENNHRLPFGCHAWDRHLDFWRPIFARHGCIV